MGESESELEIEVRTLTGESIRVSIPSNRTIQELKLLLKQIFPPAASSSNFHLFLKGMKLSLQSQISSILANHGDFVVLVPFTKKDRQQTQEPGDNETASPNINGCSTSNFAESAWSDMMQDLSSLQEREIGSDESQPHVDFESTKSNTRNEGHERNCESEFDEEVLELLTTLQSCDSDEPDKDSCERFMRVLESVNCLSDPQSRNCMLRNANIRVAEINSSCFCPPWLKYLLKAFCFLNIYYTFLQLQQKKCTLYSFEGGLNQLKRFGFGGEYADLEHLSVLCPRDGMVMKLSCIEVKHVVQFVDCETKGRRSQKALVIYKLKLDPKDPIKAKRSMPTTRIVNAMRKREVTFKTDLWGAVKTLMGHIQKFEYVMN